MLLKPTNHGASLIQAVVVVLISLTTYSTHSIAETRTDEVNRSVMERGKFRLHKFEQPIGEETYKIERDGDSLAVKIDFKFTDRGTDVPLAVSFRCAQDLTPETFEIRGKTSRLSDIDETVEVQQGKIRVPTSAGIGFEPRLERIEKLTVRKERLA